MCLAKAADQSNEIMPMGSPNLVPRLFHSLTGAVAANYEMMQRSHRCISNLLLISSERFNAVAGAQVQCFSSQCSHTEDSLKDDRSNALNETTHNGATYPTPTGGPGSDTSLPDDEKHLEPAFSAMIDENKLPPTALKTVSVVPGKGPPPEPPVTCCMSGCANCVWITYADELRDYYKDGGEKARKALEQIEDPSLKAFVKLELGL